MAQQSVRRGRKNQTEPMYSDYVNLMGYRSANSHTGEHLTLHYRPDSWRHLATYQNFRIPLATEGALTDDCLETNRVAEDADWVRKLYWWAFRQFDMQHRL